MTGNAAPAAARHAVVSIPAERLADRRSFPRCENPVLAAGIVALDGRTFAVHTGRSELPVLVDFWAPWCGPCRMMAPALERAAAEFATTARCAKVNTDEHPDPGGRFGIRSIPTLILFRHGRELARQSGAMDPGLLRRWLAAALA